MPLPRSIPNRFHSVLAGVLVAAAALSLQWAIRPVVEHRVPFLFILPALMFSAATLGRRAATIVLLLGGANAVFWLPPTPHWSLPEISDQLTIICYLAIGTLLIIYGGRLRLRSARAVQAEERLSMAQDETGMGLFELDFQANTAYASPSLCQLLGQPVMDDGCMPLAQWFAALNAGHVEDSRRVLQQKVAAGELRYEREHRVELASGEVRWLLTRVRLELDANGELAIARGAAVDITERKELMAEREQALSLARRAERRFEVALQSSSVAFTILAPERDDSGRIVDLRWIYANPAAAVLLGRPVDELVGHCVREVLPHAWDDPQMLLRYAAVIEDNRAEEFEVQASQAGKPRWLHINASPFDGSLALWFTDVTQRRAEQQALREADQRKDEFLATLAHELRNPLAPIQQAVGIARSATATEELRCWSHDVIERQANRMALMLDDLLDVVRITRGTVALHRKHSELRPMIDSAVETVRPLFDAKRQRFELHIEDAPLWLDADALRIEQVLGNLLANASKYTEEAGRIALSARRAGSTLHIAVSDNGIGLRPEEQEWVFEMFAQAPDSAEHALGGLGIGLALARRLVELHGGRLEAHSDGPGLGSTFTVTLPAAEPAAASAIPAPPAPAVSTAPAARKRILIADDNRDAADSLSLLLEMHGHEVEVAYDGEDALARYAAFRPDVALLDLGMPGRSGIEVASHIRREAEDARIMLVAVTGWGQPHDRCRTVEAGFDHHLTKPIELARLTQLLASPALERA